MSQTKAQLLGPLVGNDIDVEGDLNFDSGTFKVDPTNDRIGIKNSNPTKTLDVGGDTQVADLYYTADYPTIRPSLDLAFDKVKRLDSRVTFTRTSTATYVDENGIIQTAAVDEPRFDHNPTTGESLGLLIEEQRTNLVTYSENFSQGWNTVRATISTNTTTAPDGTTTADSLIPNSFSSSDGYTRFYYTVSNSTNYCYSIFVKQKDSYFDYVYFNAAYGTQSGTSARAWFRIDPENGAVGTVDGGATATIEEYPNGWYKCTINTISDTTGSVPFVVVPVTADNTTSFNGDGNAGVYIWGAQLEQGAFSTSYIPTSGSTVTRSAELTEITGTNFSSWYNQTEGSILVNFVSPPIGWTSNNTYERILSFNNGSGNERHEILAWINENNLRLYVKDQNVEIINSTILSNISGEINNIIAYVYKQSDWTVSVNNSDQLTYNVTIPTINRLDIGKEWSNAPSEILGRGHIKRLTYYPRRLNNSQLQNITL